MLLLLIGIIFIFIMWFMAKEAELEEISAFLGGVTTGLILIVIFLVIANFLEFK